MKISNQSISSSVPIANVPIYVQQLDSLDLSGMDARLEKFSAELSKDRPTNYLTPDPIDTAVLVVTNESATDSALIAQTLENQPKERGETKERGKNVGVH